MRYQAVPIRRSSSHQAEGDRLLGPGDVVVQRGTNHAWVNGGDTPAVIVAVHRQDLREIDSLFETASNNHMRAIDPARRVGR